MARTALAVQQIARAGTTAAYTAPNVDGHAVQNHGRGEFLHVKTGATPCTVTLQTPGTVDGLAIADRVVALGADDDQFIPLGVPGTYNQPGTHDVHVDFSAVAAVTVAALRP